MASNVKQIFVLNCFREGRFTDLFTVRQLTKISTVDGLHKMVRPDSDVNFDGKLNQAENSKIIKPVAY